MWALLSWLAEPVDSDHHFASDQAPSDLTIPRMTLGHDPPSVRTNRRLEQTVHSKFELEPKFHPKTAENAP